MELLIGKEGNQPFQITNPYVSRKHAILRTLPDGTYQLEDLGSTGGTYILDEQNRKVRQIIQTTVTPDTRVMLGSEYILEIKTLLASFRKKEEEEQAKRAEEQRKLDEERRIKKDFRTLKGVYDRYAADKIELQRTLALKNFYRSLPTVITTLIFGLTLVLGENSFIASLRPFAGLLMVILIGYSTLQVYKGQKEQPEKMEALNKQFMIDYVCPKCGSFLGFIPFESLANKKQCPSCKSKWV